jgi:LDH2 family malate/lactate/ureidoglycolate dehydrogenase
LQPHTINPNQLQDFVDRVFQRLGADSDIALEAARHLVRANLSGHDSHGVIRVPQYVAQTESGDLVPSARPKICHETPVTALIDAQRSFGLYSTVFALDWATEHAAQHGIACAAVRHSSHIGRLGEYAEKSSAEGFIVMLTVGAAGPGVGGMIPFLGAKRFLGANPWCMGIPVAAGPPLVYDGSTSTVAEGKVRVARAKGVNLAPDCIVNEQGQPSTNPDDFYNGGALVPLGGSVAGHKGYCLGLMSALFGGLASIDDPNPTLIGATVQQKVDDDQGRMAGVWVMAIDPKAFGDPEHYRQAVAGTVAALRRFDQGVLVPGEPEIRAREQRSREGITLPGPVWQDLQRISERFGVELPQ